MDLIPGATTCGSGLSAERTRMEVAAHNLANAHTTRTADGQPFKRSQVILESASMGGDDGFESKLAGVRVADVIEDSRAPKQIYAPHHPDADGNGMVQTPDISPMEEMLDMITASRSYEANLSVLRQGRSMAERTIDILRQGG